MYPRFSEEVLAVVTACLVLFVEDSAYLVLRPNTLQDVYERLYAEVQELLEENSLERLPRGEITRGTSCLLRRFGTCERVEIVDVDADGYAEVYRVDLGAHTLAAPYHLYRASPFVRSVAALGLPCLVHELRGQDAPGLGHRLGELTREGVTAQLVGSGPPYVVKLFTPGNENIGLLVGRMLANPFNAQDDGFEEELVSSDED